MGFLPDLYQGFFQFSDMFHVEQSVLRLILLPILCLIAFSGCRKPPENPHLGDFIYNDYKDQLAATVTAIGTIESQIKENQLNIQKTHPQSPQVKYFQKKVEAAIAQKDKLLQQKRYWEGKMVERQVEVTLKSYQNFYAESPKENLFDQETAEYKSTKVLRQAKANWDQKERVASFEKSMQPAKAPAGH